MSRGRSAAREGEAAQKLNGNTLVAKKNVTYKQITLFLDILGMSRVELSNKTGIEVLRIRELMSGKVSDEVSMNTISAFLRAEIKRRNISIVNIR